MDELVKLLLVHLGFSISPSIGQKNGEDSEMRSSFEIMDAIWPIPTMIYVVVA
jgi:hypothetical protein